MNAFDAAYKVLSEAGEPLHYKVITDRMFKSGYWTEHRGGETPDATVNATMARDIRHHGEAARFRRVSPGIFTINTARRVPQWMPDRLASQIAEHNRKMREDLLRKAREGTPAEFETLASRLLTAMGFVDVTITPLGGDGGIDVRGTLVVSGVIRLQMAVQAKRWKDNVGSPIVQQVRGSLSPHEQGLIITTSGFSASARKEAARPDASPIGLIDGDRLAHLLAEHQLGVKRDSHDLLAPPDSAEGE